MSLSTTSKWFLNTSRDGGLTTSLGSLFQCLTTLSVKKFFQISNLNLPWRNLRPFPLILSPVTSETNPALTVAVCCHPSCSQPQDSVAAGSDAQSSARPLAPWAEVTPHVQEPAAPGGFSKPVPSLIGNLWLCWRGNKAL